EDVYVVIGAPGISRKFNGKKVKGDVLHVDQFRKMLQITLDIDPPKKMIRKPHGDLIRDPNHQGKMYLRSLLFPSGEVRGKVYAYGYNFVDGSTNHDREKLSGAGEEESGIAVIWADAIRLDDSDDSDLPTEYINLLLKSVNKKGDAILSSEDNCLPEDIANKGKDEIRIIERSLNMNSVPLEIEKWKMLRKYDLCRTPGEDLLHRFRSAKKASIPDHSFPKHVHKMLTCLLQSDEATKNMKISFVDGAQLRIDAGFFGGTWRIHNKWMTHEGAHESAFCEERASDHQYPFACDHAVLQMYDIMLSQLTAAAEHPRVAAKEAYLKSRARARLSQMPRWIRCDTTVQKHGLQVLWESVDSHQNRNKPVKIVLHVDNCTVNAELHHRPRNVLHYLSDEGMFSQITARLKLIEGLERRCKCPSRISEAVNTWGVTFHNLDPEKRYFPSVSQDTADSFVALQPESVSPLNEDWTYNPVSNSGDEYALSSAPAIATPPFRNNRAPVNLRDSEEGPDGNIYSDETLQDIGSLYRGSTRSPSPQVPVQPSAAGAALGAAEDMSFRPSAALTAEDTNICVPVPAQYVSSDGVLGNPIEHKSLDWGGSFTRGAPDQDIYILKSKPQTTNQHNKRKASEPPPAPSPKQRGYQAYVRDGSEELFVRGSAVPRERPGPSRAGSIGPLMTMEGDEEDATHSTASSTTPLPPGGAKYRY
ncbi:hypothetical protein CC86DRAFT_435472, partial [Ophiobolus disseminans]